MRAILTMTLLATGSWAAADEVWLKGGGRIVGEVMEQRARSVVLDVGPGTVTLPMARVERIVVSASRLTEFRSRAARLHPRDIRGWVGLAHWAEQNDLRTQAREAWEHVLSVEPHHTAAQQALGNVWQGGRWMGREDSFRAQGLVEFEGQWMSPGEREARQRARTAEDASRRENALAEARVAEAEARVREAEARARSAEAAAERAEDASGDYGIPIVGYGAVGFPAPVIVGPSAQPCCGQAHDPGFCPNPRRRHDPAPRPTPAPRDGGRQPRAKPNQRAFGRQG